jgi:hypothetical protein
VRFELVHFIEGMSNNARLERLMSDEDFWLQRCEGHLGRCAVWNHLETRYYDIGEYRVTMGAQSSQQRHRLRRTK